jgi:hypothetical protein
METNDMARRRTDGAVVFPRAAGAFSCWSGCVPLLEDLSLPATPFAATDDQSLFFARAVRMVQEQIPYRDFFEIVTPGTDLIYAVGFRLFGVHAWVMPMWTIATGLAFSLLITYIAAQIVEGPTVWLPALLFLVFDFNSALDLTHQWFSTFAALAMVAVLMGGLSGRRIFSAGLLGAVAILFTQTKGTLGVLVYFIGVTKRRDTHLARRLARFVLPVVLTVACALGYYVYKAGFQRVLFDLVIFPSRFMPLSEVNTPRTYIRQLAQFFNFRRPLAETRSIAVHTPAEPYSLARGRSWIVSGYRKWPTAF